MDSARLKKLLERVRQNKMSVAQTGRIAGFAL